MQTVIYIYVFNNMSLYMYVYSYMHYGTAINFKRAPICESEEGYTEGCRDRKR